LSIGRTDLARWPRAPGWVDCSSGSFLAAARSAAARPGSSWSARSRAAARTNELDAGKRRKIIKCEEGSYYVVSYAGVVCWFPVRGLAQWSRQAPIRHLRARGRGRHDHLSGTGLLSQMIERDADAGSCRRGERARGLVTSRSWGPSSRRVTHRRPGCFPGWRAGGRRGSGACGRSRWWRSCSRGVLRCLSRWRRTPGTAWRSAPPGSVPAAARPSPAWRCARAGRSGPGRGPSG